MDDLNSQPGEALLHEDEMSDLGPLSSHHSHGPAAWGHDHLSPSTSRIALPAKTSLAESVPASYREEGEFPIEAGGVEPALPSGDGASPSVMPMSPFDHVPQEAASIRTPVKGQVSRHSQRPDLSPFEVAARIAYHHTSDDYAEMQTAGAGPSRSPTPSRRPSQSHASQHRAEAPLREESAVDPALERFRTSRTFRTRTILQLKPYTREKQIYEAALRRGGVMTGKHAVAHPQSLSTDESSLSAAEEEVSSDLEGRDEDIVIGNTPPPAAPRHRPQYRPTDLDEFLLRFGRTADVDDVNDVRKLMEVARDRRSADKEARKRARETRKAKKDFGELVTSREALDADAIGLEDYTYTVSVSQLTVPSANEVLKRSKKVASTRKTNGGEDARRLSSKAVRQASAFYDIVDDPWPLSHGDEVSRTPPPQRSPSASHSQRKRQFPSFSSRSSSDNESLSSVSSDQDPRARIARRMLPAAMLRRLEREAADKALRSNGTRGRQDARSDGPLRPGQAVARHGEAGPLDIANLIDADASDGSESNLSGQSVHSLLGADRADNRNVKSDDPDGRSQGSDVSQAEEDNGHPRRGANQSLARLYEGDFESIISGNRLPRRAFFNARQRSRRGGLGAAHRRTPLAPLKRFKTSVTDGNRAFVQTKLDFPMSDREEARNKPSPRQTGKFQSNEYQGNLPTSRQARAKTTGDSSAQAALNIRDSSKMPNVQGKPPINGRSTSRSVKSTSFADNGNVSIARSNRWMADLQQIPIDYGLRPLPLGVYVSPEVFPRIPPPGSPSLDDYPAPRVNSEPIDGSEDTRRCPLVLKDVAAQFGALYETIAHFVYNDSVDTPDFSNFNRFAAFIKVNEADEILELFASQIKQTTEKLDLLRNAMNTSRRAPLEILLRARWHLLGLSCSLKGQDGMRHDLVGSCATAVIVELLRSGLDRTLRPIKRILKGKSNTPEINDISIAIWVATMQLLQTRHSPRATSGSDFVTVLTAALDTITPVHEIGPAATERIWLLIFGLCALSQFDGEGRVSETFVPRPQWWLVRRAMSLIRVSHMDEAEERAQQTQLIGRDQYIRIMMARCIKLSTVWKWSFDRATFPVVTKDLGAVFKDRQYRNFPSEPAVDYPDFITKYDMSLTAEDFNEAETAFELYLRLVCVAASDIISSSESLSEAQTAEKDVQRLIMSTIPISSVKFSRLFPPSKRQLGQLINRYSAVIAGCYFAPGLLPWLLANCRKWAPFDTADFEARQVSIRGMMYLAVACRHHEQDMCSVVERLAEFMTILQLELDQDRQQGPKPVRAPEKIEIERTMILIVAALRQVIQHSSFDASRQSSSSYPDPCLLHESQSFSSIHVAKHLMWQVGRPGSSA